MDKIDLQAQKTQIDGILINIASEFPKELEKVLQQFEIHEYPSPEVLLGAYAKYGAEFSRSIFTEITEAKAEREGMEAYGVKADHFFGLGNGNGDGGAWLQGFNWDDLNNLLGTGVNLLGQINTMTGRGDIGAQPSPTLPDNPRTDQPQTSEEPEASSQDWIKYAVIAIIVILLTILVIKFVKNRGQKCLKS